MGFLDSLHLIRFYNEKREFITTVDAVDFRNHFRYSICAVDTPTLLVRFPTLSDGEKRRKLTAFESFFLSAGIRLIWMVEGLGTDKWDETQPGNQGPPTRPPSFLHLLDNGSWYS